jgi:hypothetical protein
MPTGAKTETKVRKSFQIEPDEDAWLAAQAAALKVSESWVVRRAIRAAMDAARGSEEAS